MGRMKKTNPMQQIVVFPKYLSMKKIHLRALHKSKFRARDILAYL